jgi:hypothetical protein
LKRNWHLTTQAAKVVNHLPVFLEEQPCPVPTIIASTHAKDAQLLRRLGTVRVLEHEGAHQPLANASAI